MELARVLKRNWTSPVAQQGASITDADTVCGSVAAHFEVHKSGRLSFFDTDRAPAQRIALAIALKRTEIDEVEYLMIEERLISELGIRLELNLGETGDTEVDHAHVDACEVSLSRLTGMVLACARAGRLETLSTAALIQGICKILEGGGDHGINEKLLGRVKETRVYKRLAKQREQSGLAPLL